MDDNIRFSRLPMIPMLGFPGFRGKYWTVEDSTGTCQGLYEWRTLEDAKAYSGSFAVTFMTGRSEPGSVSFEVIDQREKPYGPIAEGPD